MAAKRFMRMVFSPVRTRAMGADRDLAAAYREFVTKERKVTVSHGQALAALRTSSWGASTEVGPARLRQSKSVEIGNSRFRCGRFEEWQQATEIGCCRFRQSSCRSRAGPTSDAAHPSFETELRAS